MNTIPFVSATIQYYSFRAWHRWTLCDWKGRKVMIRLGVSQQYLKLESSNPWLHWNEPEVHGALSSCLFLNLFSVVIGICWGSICQSKWFTWKPEFVGLELLHHRVACFICWHWTKSTELGNLCQVNIGGVLVVATNSHPCASSGSHKLYSGQWNQILNPKEIMPSSRRWLLGMETSPPKTQILAWKFK